MRLSQQKDALRRRILTQRSLPAADHALLNARLFDHATAALRNVKGPVACYVSASGEPDTRALIDWLASRVPVLLPVLRREPDWAWFTGWTNMRPAWRGILEPTGDRQGAGRLADAEVVLCAGLAAGRDGTRLGTGGGWYDRAVPYRSAGVPLWCLLRSDEVFATVPCEAHDQRIDAILTDTGFIDTTR